LAAPPVGAHRDARAAAIGDWRNVAQTAALNC
jgi:hypothetical protein